MTKLRNGQTVIVDIGNAEGIGIRNLADATVRVYIDYQADGGSWQPITGELSLAAGGTIERRRQDLGHERVRVGVRGPDEGSYLIEVNP